MPRPVPAARRPARPPLGPGQRAILAGQPLTIVGFGEIGTAVARLELALGMRVTAVSRSGRTVADLPVVSLLAADRLPDAVADARYLVITAPKTPATTRLIDAARCWRACPPLAGAALDVFDTEPIPRRQPALGRAESADQVYVAGYGERYIERCDEILLDNVARLDAGMPRVHVVDRPLGS